MRAIWANRSRRPTAAPAAKGARSDGLRRIQLDAADRDRRCSCSPRRSPSRRCATAPGAAPDRRRARRRRAASMKRRIARIRAKATTSPEFRKRDAGMIRPARADRRLVRRAGWQVRRHQREMLAAARAGRSALLVAPTGRARRWPASCRAWPSWSRRPTDGLHTLYISPLKALAVDVQRNLLDPIAEMGLPIRVETRTGDTPADRKARQRVRPPQMLLTTPESLSLLLSHEDSFRLFAGLEHGGGRRDPRLRHRQARRPARRSRWRGCRGSRPGCAASACRRPSPIPKPIRAGSRRTATSSWSSLVEGDPGAEPRISIMLPEDERDPLVGP